MEPINIDALVQNFAGRNAQLIIQDEQGSDQAPSVQKFIKKIQLCPDGTHVRFYFDDFYFLAVPLAAEAILSEKEWTATDRESGLIYKIAI